MFMELFDFFLPPRPSQKLLRDFSPALLARIARENDGEREGFSALLPYHDARVTALVWELKYHRSRRAAALAALLLSEEIVGIASESLGLPLIVPVPMHAKRRRERGHNQTEFLCEAVMALMPKQTVAYAPRALKRTRNTPPQQGLPRTKRLQNVSGSMTVTNAQKISGRICIVIDDVATTGATLTEAKRALKESGASEIHCLALAG